MHPKEFSMFKMNGIKTPEDDLSIFYNYNNEGYRSDNFNDDIKAKVVFAGCSEGEGIGSSLESTWPGIIYNKIKNDLNLNGFYNISFDNAGFQKIFMNCMSYIKKYNAPEMFIILFPDLPRVIEWKDEHKKYYVEWYNPNQIDNSVNRTYYMNAIINFISHMHMFESYCKTNNIKLVWSIWNQLDNEIFGQLDIFANFVKFDYNLLENDIVLKQKQIRRDGHQGEYKHNIWAKNILNYMEKNETI